MTLIWSIQNNHIVLNCRCGHVGIIAAQELTDVFGEMLCWTRLSVLRGAAATGLSEYPRCKSFTLEPANMRCWAQIPSQRMIRASKYQR